MPGRMEKRALEVGRALRRDVSRALSNLLLDVGGRRSSSPTTFFFPRGRSEPAARGWGARGEHRLSAWMTLARFQLLR